MIDEAQTEVRPESQRARAAEKSFATLQKEIIELPRDQITPANASIIAGLYVGRLMEMEYLEAFEITAVNANKKTSDENEEVAHGWADLARKTSGYFQAAFNDACQGNYEKLKTVIYGDSEVFRDIKVTTPEKRTLSENLYVIAERMPSTGEPLKIPTPAWMEEPMPLQEQLQQLQKGGGKS